MTAPPLTGAAGLRARADENFREMFRILAAGSAEGAVAELDGQGACLIATGVPVAMFNPAFAPPAVAGGDFEAFMETARGFYREQGGLPWALVAPEHGAPAPRGRILRAGLFESLQMPVLTHETRAGRDWPGENSSLEIRSAGGADEPGGVVRDHRRMLDRAFGISEETSLRVLPDSRPLPAHLRVYVGYLGDQPVGAAALCLSADLAGIYNVGTHPQYRRQGIAVTLMRRVLADARALGLATSVLQSSTDGRPLYARLGFARLTTYTIYSDYA